MNEAVNTFSAFRHGSAVKLRLGTPQFKAFFQVTSKSVHVNGLLQKIDSTQRSCLGRDLPASVCRDNDAVDVLRAAAEGPEKLNAPDARHSQIGNDNHRARTARLFQGFNSIGGCFRLVSPDLQQLC
jgi:hypothetical protein